MRQIHFLLFALICFTLPAGFLIGQPQGEDIVIGQSFSMQSEILNEERPYLVYLPDDYSENGDPISVMYLLDGDGHFHHTSGVVSFLKRNGRIPGMMVVGIPNTSDRTRDLTPAIEVDTAGARAMETAGGANNMLAFIKTELIPHIEERYHTNSYKILTGHSFGGLFAVHALLSEPELFDAYLAISPSMWWDEQNLVSKAESFLDSKPDLDCYFYMTMGDEGGAMLGGAMKLAALFEEMESQTFKWDFKVMEEETHGSIPHRSTYYGLESIFKEWFSVDYAQLYAVGGLTGIKSHYKKTSEKLGYDMKPSERNMNNLGYQLMNMGNTEGAIDIFLENIQLFPNSSNVYDSAGEAYKENGQNELAIDYYKKSMRLNPGNTNGVNMLKELGVTYNPEELAIELSEADKKRYIGDYQVSAGGVLSVLVEEGKLIASHPAIPKQTLLYYDNDLFLMQPMNTPVKFTVSDGETASGFSVEMGIGNTVTGQRTLNND